MKTYPLLTIQQLFWSYNQAPLFAHFDLEIHSGEFVIIQGSSGSGKTTLMKLITGSLTAGFGHIFWGRDDIARYSSSELQEYKRNLGLVFQNNNLIESKNVKENICYPLVLAGIEHEERESRYQEIVSSLGIENLSSQPIEHLSGGEIQKVAFARSLIKKPQLILADEPTGNLDWIATKQIADTMIQQHNKGHTHVVITHDIIFAKYLQQSCNARLVTIGSNERKASDYTRSTLLGKQLSTPVEQSLTLYETP